MSFLKLVAAALWLSFAGSAHAGGYWQVKGSDALLTMRMIHAPNPNVNSVLMIAHRADADCKPELSVSIIHGLKLGKPKLQQRTSSDMRVSVDGKAWAGPTFATQYEFAQERGFWAQQSLIDAISSGQIVHAMLGEGLPTIEFPVSGAANAIELAKRNCLTKLRAR